MRRGHGRESSRRLSEVTRVCERCGDKKRICGSCRRTRCGCADAVGPICEQMHRRHDCMSCGELTCPCRPSMDVVRAVCPDCHYRPWLCPSCSLQRCGCKGPPPPLLSGGGGLGAAVRLAGAEGQDVAPDATTRDFGPPAASYAESARRQRLIAQAATMRAARARAPHGRASQGTMTAAEEREWAGALLAGRRR